MTADGIDRPASGVTSVLDLIETQTAQAPDAPAIVSGMARLSYRNLDERANHLAHRLRRLGVGPETRVGVFLEHSAEALIAVLGVWKAGAAYLPLDLDSPHHRRRLTLDDARVRLVVTQDHLLGELHDLPVQTVILDEGRSPCPPLRSIGPDNLCYVIYTSGSTGRPKGVMATHEGLLTTFFAWEQAFHLRGRITAHIQMANFSFDGFLGELVRGLCTGATLVICPKETLLQPGRLLRLMREEGVDAADFVPPVLRALVRHVEQTGQDLGFLKMIIVGSDTYSAGELARIQELSGPATQVVNCYGLSEATIDSTCFISPAFISPAGEIDTEAVLIGTALPGTEAWVLDDDLRPVTIGVTGTLYIAGRTLVRGYVGSPGQTAAAFIPHPWSSRPGSRLYRTGDLARYRPTSDGPQIEFLGRQDQQVKIHGYRVELGEIETALRRLPGVRQAAVTIDAEIRAHLVVTDAAAPADWPTILSERLPHYMRPDRLLIHSELPTTANGKLDRTALAKLPATEVTPPRSRVPPRTKTERMLAGIWAEVLRRPEVDVHENFFTAGGDSFLAMRVITRIADRWAVDIPVRSLFRNPTVARLATVVEELAERATGSRWDDEIVPVERDLIEETE